MVHLHYRLFLALCLAHLLGDFVLQGRRGVAEKRAGAWRAYIRHGVVHYLLILGLVSMATPGLFTTVRFQ